VRNTVILSVLAQVVGVALGVIVAVVRLMPNRPLRLVGSFYVWLFRGTPVLVQLFFWFNGVPSVFHTLTIALPFTHVVLYSQPMVLFMTPFMAAMLGLGLNEGAYMAEIVRAGIISVDEGQTQAAQSLGMSRLQTLRLIVIPQAMRVIIPPTGNETISMLKNTSLVLVLGSVFDLLFAAQQIYAATYQTIPLLIVASIWYLAMTSVLYVGQYFIERRYGRGFSRAQRATMKDRWLGFGHGQ
jgi:polar amino acid transport system permease protein